MISVTTGVLNLPVDLAPSLRRDVERLVAECGLADWTQPRSDRIHVQTQLGRFGPGRVHPLVGRRKYRRRRRTAHR